MARKPQELTPYHIEHGEDAVDPAVERAPKQAEQKQAEKRTAPSEKAAASGSDVSGLAQQMSMTTIGNNGGLDASKWSESKPKGRADAFSGNEDTGKGANGPATKPGPSGSAKKPANNAQGAAPGSNPKGDSSKGSSSYAFTVSAASAASAAKPEAVAPSSGPAVPPVNFNQFRAPVGTYITIRGDPRNQRVALTLRPHDSGYPRFSVATQLVGAYNAYTRHCDRLAGHFHVDFGHYFVDNGLGVFVQPMTCQTTVDPAMASTLDTLYKMLTMWAGTNSLRDGKPVAVDLDLFFVRYCKDTNQPSEFVLAPNRASIQVGYVKTRRPQFQGLPWQASSVSYGFQAGDEPQTAGAAPSTSSSSGKKAFTPTSKAEKGVDKGKGKAAPEEPYTSIYERAELNRVSGCDKLSAYLLEVNDPKNKKVKTALEKDANVKKYLSLVESLNQLEVDGDWAEEVEGEDEVNVSFPVYAFRTRYLLSLDRFFDEALTANPSLAGDEAMGMCSRLQRAAMKAAGLTDAEIIALGYNVVRLNSLDNERQLRLEHEERLQEERAKAQEAQQRLADLQKTQTLAPPPSETGSTAASQPETSEKQVVENNHPAISTKLRKDKAKVQTKKEREKENKEKKKTAVSTQSDSTPPKTPEPKEVKKEETAPVTGASTSGSPAAPPSPAIEPERSLETETPSTGEGSVAETSPSAQPTQYATSKEEAAEVENALEEPHQESDKTSLRKAEDSPDDEGTTCNVNDTMTYVLLGEESLVDDSDSDSGRDGALIAGADDVVVVGEEGEGAEA